MSCSTCSHTMHKIGVIESTRGPVFWCPRCGTTRIGGGTEREEIGEPALVQRCRNFAMAVQPDAPPGFTSNLNTVQTRFAEVLIKAIYRVWVKLGVAESINMPGEWRREPE